MEKNTKDYSNNAVSYFAEYTRSLLENSSDPSKIADIKRKYLAQSLHQSFECLDNFSVCHLLEENLKNYTETVTPGRNIYDARVKSLLSCMNVKIPNDLCSGLQKVDLTTLIAPLPCSRNKNNLLCERSENVSSEDFDEFLEIIKKKTDTNKISDQRQRKIAKNFTPQCCSSKEKTSLKMPLSKSAENFEKYEKREPLQNCFKTAKDELNIQNARKFGQGSVQTAQKRKLGTRRGVTGKFVSPLLSNECNEDSAEKYQDLPSEQITDERLKNIEPRMVELIRSEIMDNMSNVDWNDIAGLEFAKAAINEAVVWPLLRPDIFTGLRRPPKGILLFGPPGTGKTLIGKCVASQSKSTFFSISASSLTSKWIGEGEKMVRALFSVARVHQPAVIFIDEIDSLLSQRSETEHESSRRIKTEFLVQLDGATTDNEERLLLIGATNRPQELDEAARRRFVKRLYIPLPDYQARYQLIQKLMEKEKHCLTVNNFSEIATLSDGYSGADIKSLCSEASLGPIRSLDISLIEKIQANDVRPINMDDYNGALSRVKSSVSMTDLNQYVIWDNTFGSGGVSNQ